MTHRLLTRLGSTVVAAGLLLLGVTAPASAAAVCPTVAVDGTVTPAPTGGADLSGCDLSHANLAGADLSSSRLTATNLSGADLTGANLTLASGWTTNLHGATLTGADLSGSWWSAADLGSANLVGATLTSTWLAKASLDGAVLTATLGGVTTSATLTRVRASGLTGAPVLPTGWTVTSGYLVGPGADLFGARLQDVDLSNRALAGIDLTAATFTRIDLAGATLTGATLVGARLVDTTLTGSTLATGDLRGLSSVGLVGQASVLPTGWRQVGGFLVGPAADLDDTNLDGLVLDGADLDGATLVRTSLVGTSLVGTSLVGALLDSATLTKAHLATANLTGALLRNVGLESADLHGATLTGAELTSLDLSSANLRGAAMGGGSLTTPILYGADFTGATGLATRTLTGVSWFGAICPDGYLADRHNGSDCFGTIDVTAPTLHFTPAPAIFVPSDKVWTPTITASAVDTNGGAAVRYRVRSAHVGTTAFTNWVTSDWWGSAVPFPLYWDMNDERRFCYQAQGKDDAGNLTAWTVERCTDIVVDETFFLRTGTWKDGTGRDFTGNNFAYTTRTGSTMTYERRSSVVKRIGVVATACPTCGSVAVYVGTRKVGTLSFASRTTHAILLKALPVLTTRLTGRIKLVVTSPSGRLLKVSGVYVSAY